MKKRFPRVDIGPLERMRELYETGDSDEICRRLERLYKNQEEVLEIWNSTLTFFEELVAEYIKIPTPRIRDCRELKQPNLFKQSDNLTL